MLRSLRSRLVLLIGVPFVLWVALQFLDEPVDVHVQPVDISTMVFVPAGEFRVLGQTLTLDAFYIDRFEVTEAEWSRFAAETGRGDLPYFDDLRKNRDFPVRYVSFSGAEAFARWRFKDLPTVEQWERASQGPNGSPFPWGDGFLMAANTHEIWALGTARDVTLVGTFERGRSAVGCYDMIGNVWEWTSSLGRSALDPRLIRLPSEELDSDRFRIVKGGAFTTPMRTEMRLEVLRPIRHAAFDVGFRCVLTSERRDQQLLVISALRDLGYRSPVVHWWRHAAARRTILRFAETARPLVERAARKSTQSWLRERLTEVLKQIED